jgi:hypothetical protein
MHCADGRAVVRNVLRTWLARTSMSMSHATSEEGAVVRPGPAADEILRAHPSSTRGIGRPERTGCQVARRPQRSRCSFGSPPDAAAVWSRAPRHFGHTSMAREVGAHGGTHPRERGGGVRSGPLAR